MLRNLGHRFVEREFESDELERLRSCLAEITDRVMAKPEQVRSIEDLRIEIPSVPPADGSVMDHFTACPVSGQENPLGLAITVRRDGQDAVASALFDSGCAGVPGFSHGGPVCAVFDDVLGFVFSTLNGRSGYTATMTVDFKAPVRLGRVIEFRGRLARQEGRKLFMEAEAFDPSGELLASARALFLEVDFATIEAKLLA
nr:PaaI family thioesterase [Rhodococcus qingshengii]